jgi:predicted Zn finger-like uncharacterized protein
MTVTKELTFDVSDMRLISVECPKCSTEITINASKKAIAPERCPSCNKEFESSVQNSLGSYVSLYEDLVVAKSIVRFRVRMVDAKEA